VNKTKNDSNRNATINVANVDSNQHAEPQTLSQFFATDQVALDTFGRSIIVSIEKSSMLEAKRIKMGTKWVNAEADASVAAMKLTTNDGNQFDSVLVKLVVSNKAESYSFPVWQLKNAHRYLIVCKEFCQSLPKGENQIRPFFSSEIGNSMDKRQLTEFISKAFFLDERISELKLKALKVVNKNYSLYLDVCYAESGCQTYAFAFMEGSDKIAGLHVIH
jgi:hypothetical protein